MQLRTKASVLTRLARKKAVVKYPSELAGRRTQRRAEEILIAVLWTVEIASDINQISQLIPKPKGCRLSRLINVRQHLPPMLQPHYSR